MPERAFKLTVWDAGPIHMSRASLWWKYIVKVAHQFLANKKQREGYTRGGHDKTYPQVYVIANFLQIGKKISHLPIIDSTL